MFSEFTPFYGFSLRPLSKEAAIIVVSGGVLQNPDGSVIDV